MESAPALGSALEHVGVVALARGVPPKTSDLEARTGHRGVGTGKADTAVQRACCSMSAFPSGSVATSPIKKFVPFSKRAGGPRERAPPERGRARLRRVHHRRSEASIPAKHFRVLDCGRRARGTQQRHRGSSSPQAARSRTARRASARPGRSFERRRRQLAPLASPLEIDHASQAEQNERGGSGLGEHPGN